MHGLGFQFKLFFMN